MPGYSVVDNYKTTLSSSITSTQFNIPVSSVTTTDGHVITMADLGAETYLVISPGAADMEIIKCTNVGNSPPTWTASVRGMAFYGTSETAVPANQKAHNAGSVVIMTNAHFVYERLVDKESNETIGGIKTFTSLPSIPVTPIANTDAASKKYVDDTATFGAPPSTNITPGILLKATTVETLAHTDNDGTYFYGLPVGLTRLASLGVADAGKAPLLRASDGKLDNSFGGAASSLATLNGSSKVVENPASASATPATNTIPISPGGSSVLADGFQTVSAANASTLTGGSASNADALHTHLAVKKIAIITTPVTKNDTSLITEQTLASIPIPGNLLGTNNAIRARFFINSYRSGSGAVVCTTRLKYGSTTLCSFATNADEQGSGEFDFELFAAGATNSQQGFALAEIGIVVNGASSGTAAEDSTGTLNLQLTVQWNATVASGAVTLQNATIELIS